MFSCSVNAIKPIVKLSTFGGMWWATVVVDYYTYVGFGAEIGCAIRRLSSSIKDHKDAWPLD